MDANRGDLLLGLGLRQLSMPPHQLPEVKRVIRSIRLDQAQALAVEALRQETSEAVAALLRQALQTALPDTPTSLAVAAGTPAADAGAG